MFDIGFLELVVILVLALLVLGPERLPKAARTVGYWFGKARRYVEGMKSQVEAEFDTTEVKRLLHNQEVQIRELQSKLQGTANEISGENINQFDTDEKVSATNGEDDEAFVKEIAEKPLEEKRAGPQYEMIEEGDERWDELEENNSVENVTDATLIENKADDKKIGGKILMSDRLGKNEKNQEEMGFIGHLMELRDRLLRSVLIVLAIFLVAFPFANDIYHILSLPLVSNLPAGGSMIATGVISPFLTPIKLAFIVSIFVAFPYLIFEAWGFIAPGLYKHEKKLALPLIVSSALLFYIGIVFAYFIVLPNVFVFMLSMSIEGVNHAPDITYYLDFALKLFFAFGIAFEVPIATILLVLGGVTTPQSLSEKRPYIIVGAFVFGMLLTPPDPASQVMLAIPMWLLFELGLVLSRMIKKRGVDDDGHSAMTEDDMDAELDRIEAEEGDSSK